MKRFNKFFTLLTAVFGCIQIHAATIRITCRAKGIELELLKASIDEWVKKTGNQHKVEIIILPHASNECYALYQQWFSAGSFDVDILQMDTVFVGAFAEHLAQLDQYITEDEIAADDIFPSVKQSMYRDGHLLALPLYTDVEVMFCRSDLLKKYNKPEPKTWQELYDTAQYIQNEERKDPAKKSRFFGMVFQAKAFEMLTCNFVGLIDSFGGAIVKDKKITVNSEENAAAMMFLVDCMKNISSRSVLNYSEEDCRGMFQCGNAVFMPNWPYVWALANNKESGVAGKITVMPLPAGAKNGKTSGVMGGWFFTVSKYSKRGKTAADLVKYLTGKGLHKARAKFGYAPAYKSLYSDDFVVKHNPYFPKLYLALQSAAVRPSNEFGKGYQRASTEIFNTVNTILSESAEQTFSVQDTRKYLGRLQHKLEHILRIQLKPKRKSVGLFKRIENFFRGICKKVFTR